MNVSSTDFHLVRITLGTADLRPQLWHSGPAPRKRAMESPRQASRFLFFFSQRATIPVGRHCKNKSRTLQACREPGIARSRPLAAAIRATSCSRRREARSLFVRFYHPRFLSPSTRGAKKHRCVRESERDQRKVISVTTPCTSRRAIRTSTQFALSTLHMALGLARIVFGV